MYQNVYFNPTSIVNQTAVAVSYGGDATAINYVVEIFQITVVSDWPYGRLHVGGYAAPGPRGY